MRGHSDLTPLEEGRGRWTDRNEGQCSSCTVEEGGKKKDGTTMFEGKSTQKVNEGKNDLSMFCNKIIKRGRSNREGIEGFNVHIRGRELERDTHLNISNFLFPFLVC
mmetsp:Transcript_15634/g.31718  ORF Transcript_15634/g.31718 Transcript_15634/m.31718 type:complete len:107 (+) Transcript_15634:587-907(+)